MLFTLGPIEVASVGLLCSLITWTLVKFSTARRARPPSPPVSPATSEDKAPTRWESRLSDVEAQVASLSSSFEKVATLFAKQNQRAAMRALRADQADDQPPPLGSPKEQVREYYRRKGVLKDHGSS